MHELFKYKLIFFALQGNCWSAPFFNFKYLHRIINQETYDTVIGLEVHVQLNTRSKCFASDPNHFGAEPNTHVSMISLGHPGSLPRLNRQVVEHAVRLGLATHSAIAPAVEFARKHYFYTDLPKGYQISQHESPVCRGGHVMIRTKLGAKKIRLTRIHIEEDAGKSLHDQEPDASLIDLNRAGVPLLEIVTEPDLRNPEQAMSFLAEIRRMVRYLEISDGNMEEGSLRCDANVSIKPAGSLELGTRTEIKNLNSLNNVRKAIEGEVERQLRLAGEGETVIQQTRSYDAQRNLTFPLRSKEEADDYRYFPEPDLNPFFIRQEWIDQLSIRLPEIPFDRFRRYTELFNLPEQDAEVLVESAAMGDWFDRLSEMVPSKQAANWLIGPVKSWLNEHQLPADQLPVAPKHLAGLINMSLEGTVSGSAARQQILPALLAAPGRDPADLARELDLIQEGDEAAIMKAVDSALDRYPEKVLEFHRGKNGLVGLFMGEVMKASKGKADPAKARQLILEALEKRRDS